MTRRDRTSWLTLLLAAALALLVPYAVALGADAAAVAPITVPFDHLTTGFELDGVHRDLPCEACHLNAVFKGTPTDCGTCHTSGSQFNATPKNKTHVPSTNNCAACHNTISFRPAVHFDHANVMGSCVACHNGTIAQGEGPTHPATSQACEACHTVMTWNPAKAVDHTQIPLSVAGFCIVCHNGVQAAGKNVGHLATTLECGDCHLTTTWLGATFNHTGIVTGCFSCHDGVKAVGKQGNHMPTTNLCESCHTTGLGSAAPSWAPSLFDHTQMTVTTCQTCHSGTVKITTGFVSGQPTNHVPPIPSTIDCGVCHGNTPTAETWTVLAASIATLHTGLPVSNCLLCHAGQSFAGVPAPYIPMSISGVSPTKLTPLAPPHIPIVAGADCSACHGAAYQAGGFGPATAMSAAKHAFVATTCDTCHDTGKSFYTGSGTALQLRPADHIASGDPKQATADCSGCHETTDWNSTVLPVGHMPNPGNQACATCHTAIAGTFASYSTLASIAVLHTGISGNCAQCHSGTTQLTFYNGTDNPKDGVLTPAHIPYIVGSDCSSCHAPNYVTGGFGPMNMTQATHAFAPSTCNTCHEAGLSFYMGTASPVLQGRPADHTGSLAAPADCSLCHTTANWISSVLPSGHMPNPASQSCATCHTSAATGDYTVATLAANAVLHTGVTSGECAQCHGASTALTWYNNYTPKDAVLSPAHIPYLSGTDCGSCHSSTTYAAGTFGPTSMSAAKHTFVPASCDTCHEAGLNFYMGASTPALQGRPSDHLSSGDPKQATADCSGCHQTTDWTSNVMPAGHMPNPGNQACATCHTAIAGTFASYATLATIPVLHTGITSGQCLQCHGNPSAQLTFYNNNDNPKAAILTPPHIPYLTGSDCSSCHASNYVVGGFGPTNMSAAKHAFVPTSCDTCHGVSSTTAFYLGASTPALQIRPTDAEHSSGLGLTSDCSACHETTDWNSTALPAGHEPNPGNQGCNVCHTSAPTDYTVMASIAVLHTGITAGCNQCHGGSTALTFYNNNDNPKSAVLSPPHIPAFSGTDCSSCHALNFTAGGFGPMNMTQATHAGVGTTCNTCHEAGLSFYMGSASPALQGRPADHTGSLAAPADCSGCHTTANWNSTTLPAGHMPNPASQACTVCHTNTAAGDYTTATLAANSVLHTGITSGECAQCHGGTTALTWYNNFTPKDAILTPAHIPYQSGTDCGSCHSSSTYAVGGFGPMNMTQATHSFVASTCNTCHEAGLSFYMGSASPALQGRPADHTGSLAAPADCSGCHTTANWNSTTLPAGHMPNPASQACTVCHTNTAAGDYTTATLAANSVLHTGITSGECAQCHGGTTALTWYNNFTPKDAVLTPAHIPYLSGTDCGSCHSSSTYAVGGFGPMNMSQTTHAFVVKTCDTCHEAGLSFYMGTASPALQGRPTDHTGSLAAPADCSGCHTTANWNSTALPAGHMPNPANQSCTLCHTNTAAGDYTTATLAANAVLHTGISTGCITCHGAPNATAPVFYQNYTPKDALLSPVHIPTSTTPCEDCHTATVFTAFSGTTMTSAKHTSMFTVIGKTCDGCHGPTTLSFYGVTNLQTRPSNHNSGSKATGDCSGCHNTSGWGGGSQARTATTTSTTSASTTAASTAGSTATTTAKAPGTAVSVSSEPATTVVKTPVPVTTIGTTVAPGSASAQMLVAGAAGAAGTAPAGNPHLGVTANCVSCHNGVIATGKGPSHIASNNTCENCHTTLAWVPARFDHRGIAASCVSCHNGVVAAGKPIQHIPSGIDCASCHSTLAWRPAAFSHAGVVGSCQSCHNTLTGLGKPLGHVATTLDCSSCHTTQAWIPTLVPGAPTSPAAPRTSPAPGRGPASNAGK